MDLVIQQYLHTRETKNLVAFQSRRLDASISQCVAEGLGVSWKISGHPYWKAKDVSFQYQYKMAGVTAATG